LLLLLIESTDFKPFLQNLIWSSNQHVSISSFSCVWCFADMYLCAFYMRQHRHCQPFCEAF
jgi:hypothetical protein